MPTRSAEAVLNESFLEVRAKLLEVAATLDRIDRSRTGGESDTEGFRARRERIDQAIEILLGDEPSRAEKLQLLFSREYHPDWRSTMSV